MTIEITDTPLPPTPQPLRATLSAIAKTMPTLDTVEDCAAVKPLLAVELIKIGKPAASLDVTITETGWFMADAVWPDGTRASAAVRRRKVSQEEHEQLLAEADEETQAADDDTLPDVDAGA